jgi:hypothetical protein
MKQGRWTMRLKVSAMVAAVAIVAVLALSYLIWIVGVLTGCEKVQVIAWRIVAPIRYVFDHPPSWPLVAAISGLTALLLFFEPIYRFLSRLRKGPLGTETHNPIEVTNRHGTNRQEDD